jgi:hypothetical protein
VALSDAIAHAKQPSAKVSLRRSRDFAAMPLFSVSPMGDNLSGQSIGVDGNVATLQEGMRWQLLP